MRRRAARLVHLVVEEQLLIPADHVREVGEELDAVAHERVVGPAFRRRLELRAEHDRADLHRRGLELGHVDRRLERADSACRVLARHDFHRKAPRRQRHAGLVEHLLARERGTGPRRQLQRFAEPADRPPLFVHQ